MDIRLTRRTALLCLPALAGCAGLPTDQAAGTPAAPVVRHSAASVIAGGVATGAAVCVAPGLVATNAHVVRAGSRPLLLRRADGGGETEIASIRVVAGADLALLEVAPGFLAPAALSRRPPRAGDRLWAVGPEGLGRAVASGPVEREAVALPGYGRGFTVRLGALMGFSGGPVVDAAGEVAGLTTALLGAPGAGALARMVGADLDGLAGPGREVFVLRLDGRWLAQDASPGQG